MLSNKKIILGVTGSIAAYKIANLASMLVKTNADVTVIMTENATNFINPITFETLTGNKCLVDTFDRNFEYSVEHVALSQKADVMMIAPASANVIGKIANGIADDMLTTTVMACKCPVMIAPAMNTSMYTNRIVQDNINKLADYQYEIIEPDSGYLACRDTGKGKMVSEEVLYDYILREILYAKDMEGLNVLVTAGATLERIDPVRFISNPSTGKMGYAIARNAMLRGANVTLVSGNAIVDPPPFVNVINVESAKEMYDAVKGEYKNADIVIKSAAVSDYRPKTVADEKIKKQPGDATIELERTDDILEYIGHNKSPGQVVCGFSMETENMIENSKKKLKKKNIDMIIANNLKVEGAGFGEDTNVVTMITENDTKDYPLMRKDELVEHILTEVLALRK